MDRLREFLDDLKRRGTAQRNFLGMLHVLIGRRILLSDGTILTEGLTWRALSVLLKRVRWDPDMVRELGIDPARLPPRDRQRYWYAAIAQAGVDSAAALAAGNCFSEQLRATGYQIP